MDKNDELLSDIRDCLGEGTMYKDEDACETSDDAPCYVPEQEVEAPYTRKDFLNICKGNQEIADRLFYSVEWQAPETFLDEYLMEGEAIKCENCGKMFLYDEDDDIDECPYCGANLSEMF